ncbi:hypothetical protein K7X08_005034 [Anisodus acutangulus]|uniref:Uncharacterized protein n=1 Tax=Anisodus acutangulus TaxID=402998 RepID=A0A9Q1RG47_9SOLA|nr:hypothetical protein K7X08_005034 [Anisodus acutangulus]
MCFPRFRDVIQERMELVVVLPDDAKNSLADVCVAELGGNVEDYDNSWVESVVYATEASGRVYKFVLHSGEFETNISDISVAKVINTTNEGGVESMFVNVGSTMALNAINEKELWNTYIHEKIEAARKKNSRNMFVKVGKYERTSKRDKILVSIIKYDALHSDEDKQLAKVLKVACRLDNVVYMVELNKCKAGKIFEVACCYHSSVTVFRSSFIFKFKLHQAASPCADLRSTLLTWLTMLQVEKHIYGLGLKACITGNKIIASALADMCRDGGSIGDGREHFMNL